MSQGHVGRWQGTASRADPGPWLFLCYPPTNNMSYINGWKTIKRIIFHDIQKLRDFLSSVSIKKTLLEGSQAHPCADVPWLPVHNGRDLQPPSPKHSLLAFMAKVPPSRP